MQLLTKPYNIDMTLILAGIIDDTVIITSDGLMKDVDGNTRSFSFKKIYRLSDSIYVGFAAENIPDDALELLVSTYISLTLDLGISTVRDASDAMTVICQNMLVGRNDDYWIAFIVAGFDTDENGTRTKPRAILNDSHDFTHTHSINPEDEGFVMAIGSANFEGEEIEPSPSVTSPKELQDYFIERIKSISVHNKTIGGEIRCVVIDRGDSVMHILE